MWLCTGCKEVVKPEDVTFWETHDVRSGGCGCWCRWVEDGSMTHHTVLAEVREKLNKKAFGIDNKYHSWVIDVDDVMEILSEHFS